jgi:hypothetical protein
MRPCPVPGGRGTRTATTARLVSVEPSCMSFSLCVLPVSRMNADDGDEAELLPVMT